MRFLGVIRQVTLISHTSMNVCLISGNQLPVNKKNEASQNFNPSGVELANRQPPIKGHLHHQFPKLTVHFTQELQCQSLLLGENVTVLCSVIIFAVAIEVPLFTLLGCALASV